MKQKSSLVAVLSLIALAMAFVGFAPTAHAATTYYLSPSGSDSNSGTSASSPWASPDHAVNCGDTISAAAGTYSASNFGNGRWGNVSCAAGNNVAMLKCATFDACKVTSTSGDAMWIDKSYWGVEGWEASTNTTSDGACFHVGPSSGSVNHVVLADDVANGCRGGGFNAYDSSKSASVDYIAYVGDIAYNTAGGSGACYSGFNVYQPIASDANAGTHMYVGGNFSYANTDGDPCAGTAPTDGEGINFDTWDFSQGGGTAYVQQGVITNNIEFANGGDGIEVENDSKSAPIYIYNNTMYGDRRDMQEGYCSGNGDLDLYQADNVTTHNNLIYTGFATNCGGDPFYAVTVSNGGSTDSVANTWFSGVSGNNTYTQSDGSFALGSGNTVGTNPSFANPVTPGAPACSGTASVPACMASVIADYTPTVTAAKAYGYQAPSGATDALFPAWLCNVGLPSGLVNENCGAGGGTTGGGGTTTPPADTTPPSTPTNLSASAVSTSQINLSWTASTDNVGVVGYNIYRGGTEIGTATTNSYQSTGLSASTNYSYTVSAYDAAGNTSAQSSAASAMTQAVVVTPPVTTSTPPVSSTGKTYYISPSGNDSNSGTSASSPWASPDHAVNCGDVISAAPGTYSSNNFYNGKWGNVSCAAGNNVAWLKCATFDSCKIAATTQQGMYVSASYWGVSGWEVSDSWQYGNCYYIQPTGSTSVHHVIFANDVANGCQGGGFVAYASNQSAAVDYIAFVGDIAYGTSGATPVCASGFSIGFVPKLDSNPGTHLFIADTYAWDNFDPSSCAGTQATDGEGIIIDTLDKYSYNQQVALENNIDVGNGGRGILQNNNNGSTPATVYIEHNTTYGNNIQSGQAYPNGNGDITIVEANDVTATGNIAMTSQGTTGGDAIYAFANSGSNNTVSGNWLYSAAGNSTYGSGYGANTTGANPTFANPVTPGAPNCGGTANVTACAATLIANFTPTNASAKSYGYQPITTASVSDPLFPAWLCNVGLPSGLINESCGNSSSGGGTTTTPPVTPPASSTSTGTVGAAGSPAAVTNLTLQSPSESSMALTWTGSSGATGYLVMRRPTHGSAPNNFVQVASLPAGSIGYLDNNLTYTWQYDYEIIAFNASGQAVPSAIVTYQVLGQNPGASAPSGPVTASSTTSTGTTTTGTTGTSTTTTGTGVGTGIGTGTFSSSTQQLTYLQSLVTQVLALIQSLNTQSAGSYTRDLTIGSIGQDVQTLQQFLNDNGYAVATSSGTVGSIGHEGTYFGWKTQDALRRFQKGNHLPGTGYFGPITRQFIEQKWGKGGGQ
jgi:hypothetical protein